MLHTQQLNRRIFIIVNLLTASRQLMRYLRYGDPSIQLLSGLKQHFDYFDAALHAGEMEWGSHFLVTAPKIHSLLYQHPTYFHFVVRRRQMQSRHLLLVHSLEETNHLCDDQQ